MKPTPRDTATHPTADREPSARERDEAAEPADRDPRERKWRIGATQLAAPPTRRWRRAGRFDQAS